MIPIFQRIVSFAALTLLLVARSSHAADVAAWPNDAPITSLAFAPDGQTLWSVGLDDRLTVGASDGLSVYYRGEISHGDGAELKVLRDGSFLWSTSWSSLQWFEPPQPEQPLKSRYSFDGPEADGWKEAHPYKGFRDWPVSSTGTLAVSPDQKRVAYGFEIRPVSLGTYAPFESRQAVIRVWNLETKAMESEHLSTQRAAFLGGDAPARLAWADAQTLVVARGLALERFDATTGAQVSAWKPANAPKALGQAKVKEQQKRLRMSPAQRDAQIRLAPSFPFDVERQRLLALSPDGTQLLVCDSRKLLTLWDSATGEARILSDNAEFVPFSGAFSPDGTRVVAWTMRSIRSWLGDNNAMSIPERDERTVWDVALGDKRMAFALGQNEVWSLPLSPPTDWGQRPVRLQDLKPAK